MKRLDDMKSLSAFAEFCDEVEQSALADSTDCQYWVFERGYKAAMQQILASQAQSKSNTN